MRFVDRTLTTKVFIKNPISYMCGFTYYSFLKFLTEPWPVQLIGAFWKKWFRCIITPLNLTLFVMVKGSSIEFQALIHHKLPSLGQLILSFIGAIAFGFFFYTKMRTLEFNTPSIGGTKPHRLFFLHTKNQLLSF